METIDKIMIISFFITIIGLAFLLNSNISELEKRITHLESVTFGSSRCIKDNL
jgi:hypothetical protein